MDEELKGIEKRVTEFGNGAHVTVPREHLGEIARIQFVGPWTPPLFEDVEDGKKVFVTCENGEEFSGEVFDYRVEIQDEGKTVRGELKVDTGHEFYRISVERHPGMDGWPDEYELERAVSDPKDEDGVISMEINSGESEMWVPDGRVAGIAVLREATTDADTDADED